MSATLLSFTRRAPGWENEERALLARVERLISASGLAVEIEEGVSEDGDPWCVICNAVSGEVVIHIARIDGRYLLDATALARPIEGRSLTDCANRFLESARLVAPAANAGATLWIHPGALLAGVYMTILLFVQMHSEKAAFIEAEIFGEDAEGAEGAPVEEDAPETAEPETAETETAEPAIAAPKLAPWLAQIAQFVAGEARSADRLAERGGERLAPDAAALPSGNWVMLQSAAMIATLVVAQDQQTLAALLGIGIGPEQAAQIAAAAEEAALAASAALAETPDKAPATLADAGEAAGAEAWPSEALAALEAALEATAAVPPAPAMADGTITVSAESADTDAEAALADASDATGALQPHEYQGAESDRAAGEESSGRALEVALEGGAGSDLLIGGESTDHLGEAEAAASGTARVVAALVAGGARVEENVEASVREMVFDLIDAETLEFADESSAAETPGGVLSSAPPLPVRDAPFLFFGQDEMPGPLQPPEPGGVAGAERHTVYDLDWFDRLVDDVASNGRTDLEDGNVIYYHDHYRDSAAAEDLLVLSFERGDGSLAILVTYASAVDDLLLA